jgi:NADPH2:quinone reductase
MQGIRVHDYGGPEVMRVEDLPTPAPGPGQALVRVEAAGVNFIDIYQRSGQYRGALPFPLGSEGAGVVESVGPDVADLAAGDRVAWAAGPGTYATHVVIPAEKLVVLPPGVGTREAAAVMLQGITAHYLTHNSYPLKAGETCLIHAAAGGVGLLLCQMATMRGARVIGTVSTDAKARLAREAGAGDVILYTQQDFEAETRRLTGGAGVDVVYDSVGKDTFDKSLSCLRTRGTMVLFGQSSGAVAPLDPQVLNAKGSLFLTRPTIAHHMVTREELLWRAGDILGAVDSGKLRVRIDRSCPLAQAAEAHRALAARETTGKLLLIP